MQSGMPGNGQGFRLTSGDQYQVASHQGRVAGFPRLLLGQLRRHAAGLALSGALRRGSPHAVTGISLIRGHDTRLALPCVL